VEERQEEVFRLPSEGGEEKKGHGVLFSLFSPSLLTLERKRRE
jgi:hypothetical protein